jgi:hypothetical protein
VEVDAVVAGVGEPVQALALVLVGHHRGHADGVVLLEVGQGDPGLVDHRTEIEGGPVEHHLPDLHAGRVQERGRPDLAARERDP